MENIKKISLKLGKSKYERKQITSSKMASDYIRGFYGNDMELFESCFILLLDQSNTTLGYAKISQGGICSTIVDIKIVCKYVVDSLAQGVIICHNHPSGNSTPSLSDKNLTEKLASSLKMLDTKLFDHIILTKDSFYSMQDNGEI
jgi:DNA repair protein RadC